MWNRYQEDESSLGGSGASGTAVIYGGRTDTCRLYAEWLAERREAELFALADAKLSAIKNFRTIIYILPVYDGKLEGLDSMIRNYPKLMKVTRSYANDMFGAEGEKRIGLLAVGLSPEKDAFRSGALDLPTALEEVPVYYAMGRYQPDEADSRTLLRMDILEKAIKKDPAAAPGWFMNLCRAAGQTDDSQPADQKVASGQGTGADAWKAGADLTDPAYLDPILDLIDGR
ncbi:MAG: hypothetical protein J5589_06545 [Firmicutes bacterium]|nr:hypothetical protein [Bacillota bacterium]